MYFFYIWGVVVDVIRMVMVKYVCSVCCVVLFGCFDGEILEYLVGVVVIVMCYVYDVFGFFLEF